MRKQEHSHGNPTSECALAGVDTFSTFGAKKPEMKRRSAFRSQLPGIGIDDKWELRSVSWWRSLLHLEVRVLISLSLGGILQTSQLLYTQYSVWLCKTAALHVASYLAWNFVLLAKHPFIDRLEALG